MVGKKPQGPSETHGWARICAAVLMGISLAAQNPAEMHPKALREMVETERAFAALGAEKGVRESFFKFFGEEGISFSPHPGKFRENARRNPQPNPPPPLEFKLEWWPVYGDVADSGELGYNTGPTLVTDRTAQHRPPRHGYFFSVWKMQPDGAWRVAVDMGSDTPGPDPAQQDRTRYTRAPQEKYRKVKPASAAAGRAEMLAMEWKLEQVAREHGRAGYVSMLGTHCRVHRPGRLPILGRDAAAKYFDEIQLTVLSSEGMDGAVAQSGELGYTYGRYEAKMLHENAERAVQGYFTHVWKRDGRGDWKLVADVINVLPPPSQAAQQGGQARVAEIGTRLSARVDPVVALRHE
jgi:ketosteroid isomerase-like protein